MHRLRRRLQQWAAEGPFSTGGRFFGPEEIRAALLSLLGELPSHGYQLMTRLEERCGGAYRASAGTIYPTLQQLEDERLIRGDVDDGGRRVFTLTAAGRRECEARAADIDAIWRRADGRSEWGVLHHPDGAEIVGPALRLAKSALKAVIKSHGDPLVIDAVRQILDEARDRIARLPSTRSKR